MEYNEALDYIHSLAVFGSKPGLDRIKKLLKALGNPEKDLKYIHVAGTNGKGSTSAMLSEIYQGAGFKTGLYTSPYVIDFRERIQFNGKYIEKEALTRLTEKVKSTGVFVTEFEFITALAFLYFKEQNSDIVILEVGMGGRFDATNVIDKPLCSVICRIDLDHTDYLGNTYSKIAMEKCGIIKPGCPATVYPIQEAETLSEISKHRENFIVPDLKSLKIISSDMSGNRFIYKNEEYQTMLVGKHQIYNALTVIETVKTVGGVSRENIVCGIKNATLPARVEIINRNPDVVLDGSHNPNGAEALAFVMEHYANDIIAVIGMMRDKDTELFIEKIAPFCSSVITVTVDENPRSAFADELKLIADKYCTDVSAAKDYDEALLLAKRKSGGKHPIFVCGSLYLACSVRDKMKNDLIF